MLTSAVVHLIDDDDGVRRSLAFALTTAGLAVRVYESGAAFLQSLASIQPGCIVTDIRMPGIDGIELQRQLLVSGVKLPVIVMTGHADVRLAVDAMKAGAVDFIEKPFDDEVLLTAIRLAMDRFDRAGERQTEARAIRARLASLSSREQEVLDGLVAGLPNKTIASDLRLSSRTVEVYRANVMTKMGARSLSELVRMTLLTELMSDN